MRLSVMQLIDLQQKGVSHDSVERRQIESRHTGAPGSSEDCGGCCRRCRVADLGMHELRQFRLFDQSAADRSWDGHANSQSADVHERWHRVLSQLGFREARVEHESLTAWRCKAS
jgi:hypothetical protein